LIWYPFVQALVRTLWRPVMGPYEVSGIENVPDQGPFILVANHQSYLDPILLQAVVRRPVCTMAKSTQFSDPITGTIVKSLKGLPARRFETDPQVVRLALRALTAGDGVGVYIEGERTWDGRLQPPRLGTIRLILKAGVPVVPAGINGAYKLWPRWTRRPRRGPIHIRVGRPLVFPNLDRRADREAILDETAEQVMAALGELVEEGDRDNTPG